MTDNFWKDKYPVGVASEINPDEYQNIRAVLKQSCELRGQAGVQQSRQDPDLR